MLELVMIAILTALGTIAWIKIAKAIGHTGKDIHKESLPEIPESSGLTLRLAASTITRLLGTPRLAITIFLLGLIGLIDDFFDLGPKTKTLLSFLAGIPALKCGFAYLNTPLGAVRVELLYLLAVPIGYGIYANSVNMIDSVNTVAVGSTALILAFQTFRLYLLHSEAFMLALGYLLIVLAYLPFNLYPARAFNGDVGDFVLGAMIFTVALYGHFEIPTLIASIPFITNGLVFIFSVGVKTRKQFPPPTKFEHGKILPTNATGSPKTLVRMIASISCGIDEKGLIKTYMIFFLISIALASLVAVMYL